LQKFKIVENVIDSTSLPKLCFTEEAEIISFEGVEPSSSRTQRTISNGEALLPRIYDAFRMIFPGCTEISVRLVTSKASDKAQEVHTDYNIDALGSRVHSLKAFHYSALVAIQEDTILLVGKEKTIVGIPLNGMIIWRGDMPHAGGGYVKRHKRIFISISSIYCPVTSSVYLVK
jgi:hypothetical protein